MRRSELEHAIRAATEIIAADEIIVIGSQAILGSFTDTNCRPRWSIFHETHGFYVQGVGRETAVLPVGWEQRLVPLSGPNTNGRTDLCLDPHDLCLAKLAAARDKDHRFVTALLDARLVRLELLRERVPQMRSADPRARSAIIDWIDGYARRVDREPPPMGSQLGL